MAYQIMTLKGFINEVRMVSQGPHPRKFCFVLGAGASKTSGIKTGEELVEIWDRELAERNPRDHEEWKKRLDITEKNRGSFYSDYYQRRFPRDNGGRYRDGYNYLEQLMDKARPSGGYVHLALIMANTMHNVVVTTNFDHLVEDSLVKYTQKMPMVIGHEKLAPYATEKITRPTVVKIHRDLYTDPISKPEELNTLHKDWVEVLDNLFTHYHPVFIGYAGNDNSVMDFLCNNVNKFNSDRWACPYWLIYGDQLPEGKVRQFLEESNGYLISHMGFDQVMIFLSNALGQRLPSEKEYIKKTREQYKSLMDSVSRLLEDQLPDGRDILLSKEEFRQCLNVSNACMISTWGVGQIMVLLSDALGVLRQRLSSEEKYTKITQEEYKVLMDCVGRLLEEQLQDRPLAPQTSGRLGTAEIEGVEDGTLCSQCFALHTNGECEKAQEYIHYLRQQFPDNQQYHYSLGIALYMLGQYEEALEETRKAIELEPENAWYHDQLSVTLHTIERYEEALIEVKNAVNLEPDKAQYHNSLGATLHAMERYEEALIEVKNAIELEPNNARYHDNCSATLHAMERYQEATEETHRAIELDPENPDYYDSLAITLRAMGQEKEAAEMKKKAEELRVVQPNT